ncbi:MAG: resuscitation-promoting factor RpfE [Thermoleophilaceae bacterium]|nr:resuscitation-promoting factor RpfE [Thermoleophilaceae bacterium]
MVACACAAGAALAAPAAQGSPSQQLFISETDAFVSASRLPDAALSHTYLKLYAKTTRRGGHPGRNILFNGVATHGGRVRAATRRELRRSLRILRRSSAPVAVSPQLEAIAQCESGGDPTAIGGGGLYRGKYQFSVDTWRSVGGTGDPATAPEAEQDRRAAMLLARSGTGQWPVCGA